MKNKNTALRQNSSKPVRMEMFAFFIMIICSSTWLICQYNNKSTCNVTNIKHTDTHARTLNMMNRTMKWHCAFQEVQRFFTYVLNVWKKVHEKNVQADRPGVNLKTERMRKREKKALIQYSIANWFMFAQYELQSKSWIKITIARFIVRCAKLNWTVELLHVCIKAKHILKT